MVKDFSAVSEADVFLEFSGLLYDPANVGNLISGSSAFYKSSLNIWKFSVHVLLKPSLENCEHYIASVWDECNCAVVWSFFGIAFLWDWDENWPFPVLWPLLSFPNLLAYWVPHSHSITTNKASGVDRIPAKLFQILKDDAVWVRHSICQQIWKTQQWPQDWKRSIFIPIPKKGNAKKCSNYHTIALISHASKIMLKILQARLQPDVNCEHPDV